MQTVVQQCRPLHDNNTISRSKIIETPAGTLVLRDFCSPSLVESLRAECGLRAFASYGFSEYLTSEPNIRMDPANILLARIGRHVSQQHMNHFLNRLLSSQNLPGL